MIQYIRDDVQWIMLPDMLCNRIKGFAGIFYFEISEAFGDTDIDRYATPRDLAAGAHISLVMSVRRLHMKLIECERFLVLRSHSLLNWYEVIIAETFIKKKITKN